MWSAAFQLSISFFLHLQSEFCEFPVELQNTLVWKQHLQVICSSFVFSVNELRKVIREKCTQFYSLFSLNFLFIFTFKFFIFVVSAEHIYSIYRGNKNRHSLVTVIVTLDYQVQNPFVKVMWKIQMGQQVKILTIFDYQVGRLI